MGYPCIINVDTFTLVNPAEIFGKDANRLLKACNSAFHNWLPSGKYEGCYRSPSRPTLRDVRETINISKGDSLIAAYKAAMVAWESANPEEVAKEHLSRKEWEDNRDKQFRIIYGIARRHGLYLDWHGTSSAACCGDQWTIYKHNERIARIYCL